MAISPLPRCCSLQTPPSRPEVPARPAHRLPARQSYKPAGLAPPTQLQRFGIGPWTNCSTESTTRPQSRRPPSPGLRPCREADSKRKLVGKLTVKEKVISHQ